jgi:hypothetical protein
MLLAGSRPTLGFIPSALPALAPVAAPVVAGSATAVGVGVGVGALPLALGGIVLAGAWVSYYHLAKGAGVDPWGLFNSRPGKPAVNPPGVPIYPTGDYNPKGGNIWRWSVTGMYWGPNPGPTPNVTRTFQWQGGAGRYAWLVLRDPQMSHNGVLEYDDAQIHEGPALGVDGGQGLMGFLRSGGFLIDAKFTATVEPATPGTGQPLPQPGVAFPDGWVPPGAEPEPQVLPLPPVLPARVPAVRPAPLPEAQPSPVPVAPGVVAPPMVGTGSQPKVPPPIPATATPTGPDGRPLPKPGPLVPTTPQDVHFPGGIPITSNPPQPTLQGIAQEVGRIENKLNKLLAPGSTDVPDWIGLGWRIWDFLSSASDAGEYSLHGTCEKDADGNPIDSTRQFPWGGSFGAIGNVASRVDAIAEMLQYSKELKQPICKERPQITGEWVTVNFESAEKSPAGDKPLRKVLRYRDQNAHELEAHVAHWKDFEWQAGPVMVIHKGGVWGVPQVWASSADEGKRVIRHAATIAGVNLEAKGSEWHVSHSASPRVGKPGLMKVQRLRNGAWMISKRVGSDGLPEYVTPVLGP